MALGTTREIASAKRQNTHHTFGTHPPEIPFRRNVLPLEIAMLLALSTMAGMPVAQAASFVIANGQTDTDTQILEANETGVIEVGGEISTTKDFKVGIYSGSENAVITNKGTVSTAGLRSFGIYSEGIYDTITNSGRIITNGKDAVGIASLGDGATITNSGTIRTEGTSAYGVYYGGSNVSITDNVPITNNGTINTRGELAHGIYSNGYTSITNSGSISTTGTNAHGIQSLGENTTITNSGLISATGSGSFAILGSASRQTLNLLPGSRIVGPIDLGGGGDIVNIYGTSGSSVMSFANAKTINLLTPNAVKAGNSFIVIDPTGESSRSQSLAVVSSGLHNVISQHLQGVPAAPPVKLAALEITPGMLNLAQEPVVWGQIFGSQSRRGSDGQSLGFTHHYGGVMGGYERDYQGDRIGLVAGVVQADTSSPMAGNRSDGVFAGLYRYTRHQGLRLTASLMAGVEKHANRRTLTDNLNGYETARGNNNSFFISPSVSVGSAYVLSPLWQMRPSATLGYSIGWYKGYSESGTTSANLTMASRTLQSLTARMQVEAARQIGLGEVSLRAGVQARQTSEGAVWGSVGGSDFRFNAAGKKSAAGSFVGLGVRQALQGRLSLMADVEYGQLSGNEKQVTARVSLRYQF